MNAETSNAILQAELAALREERDRLRLRLERLEGERHAPAPQPLSPAFRDELEDLYNHAPCGYHSLDRNGVILRMNDTELAWLGYGRGEIVGKRTIYDLMTAASAEAARECFPRFIEQGAVKDVEVDMVKKDGQILTVLLSATALRDAAGNYVKSRSTVYDITERKRVEAQLRRSEESLAHAQRIAHLGSWDWDVRSGALAWSDEVFRIFGCAPQSFGATYQAFLERVHPDDREAVETAVEAALQGRRPYEIHHRIIRSDGSERVVHEQAEVIVDAQGQPVRMVGTVHDVTEYRRAQEEIARREAALRQAEELAHLKSSFINAVSHDLRAPLMSILGYAEFLEDEIGGPITSQQRDFVRQIEGNTKRLEFMVNDLLDFARMEAGTFKLNMADHDLRATIDQVLESLRPLLEEAGLCLKVVLPPEPLVARMDEPRIERVLMNLLTNAMKFTAAGGTLTVRGRRMEGRLVCEVEDTGIGIAPEDVRRLFQRFSQLEAGMVRGGTGLGLSISKAFIEAQGGQIGVRSAMGKGSTFWFSLPGEVSNG